MAVCKAAATCGLAVLLVLAIPLAPVRSALPSPAAPPWALISPDGYFVENRGQLAREDIRLYSLGNPAVGFETGGISILLREPSRAQLDPLEHRALGQGESEHAVLLRVRFEGASPALPVGQDSLGLRTNFFLGNDPTGWRTHVPGYREVVYSSLYPGIDLLYRALPSGVKYEFRVAPGADPSVISIAYQGDDGLRLAADGALVVATAAGNVRDTAPIAAQGSDTVPCPFVLRTPQSYGFACDGWDRARALVIDPLIYSTFLGGRAPDSAARVAVDSAGEAYVAGQTYSIDFPATPGAFDMRLNGTSDAYVTKLSAAGDALLYSTFLGGSGTDVAFGLAVDSAGSAYVTGVTDSTDFPVTAGAFDPSYGGGYDTFVTRLGPTGDSLVYSTFLGGSQYEEGRSIAVDSAGGAYVSGQTGSDDFPTTAGAFDRTREGIDGFVTSLTADGSSVFYSTFFGGSGSDRIFSVVVDPSRAAYVTGSTDSTDLPVTAGGFARTLAGRADAFVAKFDAAGSGPIYATYLGGSSDEYGLSIAVDPLGYAYVTGWTESSDFPTTPGAYAVAHRGGVRDAFVTKVDLAGAGLVYSTFLGGSARDAGDAIVVDGSSDACILGATFSADFPVTAGSVDTTFNGAVDAFVTRLNATGASLAYSTFLGGGDAEVGNSIAIDPLGDLYVVGGTYSFDFPVTPGAYDVDFNGGNDAFVVKLRTVASSERPDLAVTSADLAFNPPAPATNNATVTVAATIHNLGDGNATQVVVRFYDGVPSGPNQIGPDRLIPYIVRLGGTASVSVFWIATPPELHDICVFADPGNRIAERNEANNQACAPIEVVRPPDYAPWNPLPLSPVAVGLARTVPFSVAVLNQGDASANATATLALYNASTPATPFATFLVPLLAPAETSARFTASWISPAVPGAYDIVADVDYRDDLMEWNETNNRYAWTVSVVPGPFTNLLVGAPNVTASVTYVTSATPLSFEVLDQSGTGIRDTMYRVDGGPWVDYTATGPFALAGEGAHVVVWSSEDNAGNVEPIANATLRVDDTAPTTTLIVGDPNYLEATTFVTSATPLTLAAADGGLTPVGVGSTEYRIDSGPWTPYAFAFTLAAEGVHAVEYRSADRLGNMEAVRPLDATVDDTPPVTTIAPGAGTHAEGTSFALAATDSGSGVAITEYAVDGGVWVAYTGAFSLALGEHVIAYRSADQLNNTEAERMLSVTISGEPPPPPLPEPNWKPFVAAVFTAILALVGAWSARRVPWPSGSRHALRAFALTGLPFALAEAATGVVSLLTGLLSIPPVLGLGTAVDVGILVTGVVVLVYRVRKWTPPE